MSTTNEHNFRSTDQLKSLFLDQRWLITRLAEDNGAYQGYLADLVEAWKIADAQTRQQLRDGQPPTDLADCVRYALIHCTIVGNLGQPHPIPSVYSNNADTQVDPEFPYNFLPDQTNENSSDSSLEAIRRIKEPERRIEHILKLLEQTPSEEREPTIRFAIESMLAIQDSFWDYPGYSWERLDPYLQGENYAAYAKIIFSSSNEAARAWFIRSSGKAISGALRSRALDVTFSIQDPIARNFTLMRFVHRSRGKRRTQIIQEMYRSVGEINDPRWKSRFLQDLIRNLNGKARSDVVRQAMETIPLIGGYARGWDAAWLMPYLTSTQRKGFLKEVLSARGLVSQVEAYITLWDYLPKKTQRQAIKAALQVRDLPARAKYLAQIAANLSSKTAYQQTVQHVAEAIQNIRNEDHRHNTIREVKNHIQDKAIDQVSTNPIRRLTPNIEKLEGYRFAFAQRDPQHVAYALGNLSACMDDGLKEQAIPLMVDLALEIDLHDYVAEAIEGIAPYLDQYYLGKALEGALQIANGWSRVWALSGLAPYLTGEQLKVCLDDALNATGLLEETGYQPDGWFSVDMAARLIPSLKDDIREKVITKGLQAAKTDDNRIYDARIRFLPYLEQPIQSELASQILDNVLNLPDEGAQSRTLSGIAPFLPESLIELSIEHARTIEDDYEREGALSALIPRLPNTDLAIEQAELIAGPYRKSGALIAILPHLTGDVKTRTLQLTMDIIETIKASGYRMGRWVDLLPLTDDQNFVEQKVINSMLDYLWEEQNNRRNNILALCANSRYASNKILPLSVLQSLGQNVMEICMEWKW